MLLPLLLFLFVSTDISGMNHSPYPAHVAYFSNIRPVFQQAQTHFADITAQRIGNVHSFVYPATAFFTNQTYASANPMLTQLLISLRSEYASSAFTKTAGGFSLVENYFDSNYKPTPHLSSQIHAHLNQLHQTLYQTAHFNGSTQSLESAMQLVNAHVPVDAKLLPIAHAWNKAVQEMSAIVFDHNGSLKNSLTEQESLRLIHIHCEYLKSTTNCLAEWYDQIATLSYGDARYLTYLKQILREQNSIANKACNEGPLRGIDKLTSNVVGFCKTCTNWFVGNRSKHEQLHALNRNSTNSILKSVISHCKKGEFQAALDYGNQAGIFKQYPILHREIIGKLPKITTTNTVSSQAVTSAQVNQLKIDTIVTGNSAQDHTLDINRLIKPPSEPKGTDSWPYSVQAPVVAAFSHIEQKSNQVRSLTPQKKIQLSQTITQQMNKELSTIKQRSQETLFVEANDLQRTILHGRKQALALTEQSNVMFEKRYKTDAFSAMMAKEINADQRALEYCFGNHIQQHLHGEFVKVIHESAQQYYTKNASISQREVNKMVCEWAFTGLSRNQEGKVAQATSLANLCWSALDFAQATLDATNSAVNNAANYLINVIDKVDGLLQEFSIPQDILDSYRNAGFENIPQTIRPESRILKCIVRYVEGRIRGPLDLIAHPSKNITATIASLKPLGKLAVTYIDYCDTLDSAHLLEPAACTQKIAQLEQNLGKQVETITHEFLESYNTIINLSAEDISYLVGNAQGQQKLLTKISSIGSKIKAKFVSRAVSNPNLEYWQQLAAAMNNAQPIQSFTIRNTHYVFYDNGAIFAGTTIGSQKKMWCVSPPKRITTGPALLPVARYNANGMGSHAKTAQMVKQPISPTPAAVSIGQAITNARIAAPVATEQISSTPELSKLQVDVPTPDVKVSPRVLIDPVTPQLKAEWAAQKKEVVKTLKRWIDQYQNKVGKTAEFIEHRDWLRAEIQEFNKPECAHHIATTSNGVHTIIPKELQPFIPSQKEIAQLEKQLDIIPAIKKISGKEIDVLIGNLEHVFCPEIKVNCETGKVGIQGAHYYPVLKKLEKEGLVKVHSDVLNADGTNTVNWSYHGCIPKDSSCFPEHWTKENIVQKINESIKNIVDKLGYPNGRLELTGLTQEGIRIKIIFQISEKGSGTTCNIISCFPLLKKGD
ncbi:hypothetical protein Noda2021_04100 [Candidatus Dependentiae bacterium Noda2021]|nr:hypothetical protein Noda2021_04100 [Candidatus Dependentiae bacterium Noda2021]